MPQNVPVSAMLDRLPAAGVAALAGWCLGWASAWLTAWLHPDEESARGAPIAASEELPTPSPGPIATVGPTGWLTGDHAEHLPAFGSRPLSVWWRRMAPDLLVQGISAVVWGAIPLLMAGGWLRWVEAGVLTLPLIQVAVTDLRTRYVYTVVAAVGIGLGLAFGWQVHAVEWWTSLAGAAGGAVGFGVLYLLGRLWTRGRVEAMARGDIGIAAMVGAGAAACAAQALFLGVLIGGVIAVGVLIWTRSRHGFMPYGPGLCLGGLATLFLC